VTLLIVILLLCVALDVAALHWGVDSREPMPRTLPR